MNKNLTPHFLIALGAGIAFGVLCAPTSGRDLRRLVSSKTKKQVALFKQRATAMVDSATGIAAKGRAELILRQTALKTAVGTGRKAYLRSVA